MSFTLVVSGTDTDAGKTFLTSALMRKFSKAFDSVAVVKPIQTGCLEINGELVAPDLETYSSFDAGLKKNISIFCFEKFKAACAPNLAASLENKTIEIGSLVKKIKKVISANEVTLIEGAGGLMVPINDRGFMMIDLIRELGSPVLLVAPNRVGTINHVLLSVNELGRRQIPICGIILNHLRKPKSDEEMFLKDNFEQIKKLCPEIPCHSIPFFRPNKNDFFAEIDGVFQGIEVF